MCCALGGGARGQAQQDAQAPRAWSAGESSSAITIVIVRTPRDARVVKRVRAELEAWAARVIEIGPARELQAASLAELAHEHGAEAVLRVHAPQRRVELWVARPVDAELGTLETITADAHAERSDEILAVRVTEVLRAWDVGAALPGRADPHGAPGVATEPTEPTDLPAAREPATETEAVLEAKGEDVDEHEREDEPEDEELNERGRSDGSDDAGVEAAKLPPPSLWLELGPAITFGPGALSPQLQALLGARVPLGRRYSISALALLPVLGGELDAPEGRARLTTWLLGAAADAHVELSALSLGTGAGMAAVLARALAEAPAPGLDAVDDSALAVAPFARVSAHLKLGSRLGLCARGHLGAALPAITVRLVDRDRARWGRPFASASLSLEAAF